MTPGRVGLAVVGAGMISRQYLTNLMKCPDVSVVSVADLNVSRAASVAHEYGVPHSGDLASVLARDAVEIVVNLTIPSAHAEVAQAALEAGKHVYGEKPLTVTLEEGEKLIETAANLGLRVGCAPDTILGSGIQSAARAIADGAVGTPVAAVAAFQSFGPEPWHPNPEFYFQPGAGPLFDMGPYYLSTLVTMLGGATRVVATARQGRQERIVGSGPKAGTTIAVEVSTYVNALIEFESGPAASTTFSFDSTVSRTLIEIVGTEATLNVPDPNRFDGSVQVLRAGEEEWSDLPVEGTTMSRGIGVVEMARAIRAGRPHRASGQLGLHVLEMMTAITESADEGRFCTVHSRVDRPEPLEPGWDPQRATLG